MRKAAAPSDVTRGQFIVEYFQVEHVLCLTEIFVDKYRPPMTAPKVQTP
jgi:hypothetical protein